MNPRLKPYLDKTVELLRADPRVLAGYMSGSVGTPKEDVFSDVDPVFMTRPSNFESLDGDLPGIFAEAGIVPVLWWPERGNNDLCRNYAVFFHDGDALLQYDVTIDTLAEGRRRDVLPGQILFDKAEVLQIVSQWPYGTFSPERLRWFVEFYWIYAYILGKYLRRGDAFKIIAARQELFTAHLHVAHALEPATQNNWWPVVANDFKDPAWREALLGYWQAADSEAFRAALPDLCRRFSADARRACAQWRVGYPEKFERDVRAYLTRAGVLAQDPAP